MIDRDKPIDEQVDQWLETCYNPDSMMSSTEKLSQAYRMLNEFKLRLEDGRFRKCPTCDGYRNINRNSRGDPQYVEICPECQGEGVVE